MGYLKKIENAYRMAKERCRIRYEPIPSAPLPPFPALDERVADLI